MTDTTRKLIRAAVSLTLLTAFAASLTFTATGCKTSKGAADDVEDAADDVGDAIEDAAD